LRTALIGALILAACDSNKEDTTSEDSAPGGVDSAPPGDTALFDYCAVPMEGSGAPTGSIDCTDGVCEVPAGPFWQGRADPAAPEQCPPRLVELSAFAIDDAEVTTGEYDACVREGACEPAPSHCHSEAYAPDPLQVPVICVDWYGADAYCAWAGGRLPTEAEWEKAARGAEGSEWPWGDWPPDCLEANYRISSSYCHLGVLEQKYYDDIRSAYGLWDTVGNAWEWTADWFDAGYYRDAYEEGLSTDPPGPSESCRSTVDDEPEACVYKTLRGGAFNTTVENTRGATRSVGVPTLSDVNISFRCAFDR